MCPGSCSQYVACCWSHYWCYHLHTSAAKALHAQPLQNTMSTDTPGMLACFIPPHKLHLQHIQSTPTCCTMTPRCCCSQSQPHSHTGRPRFAHVLSVQFPPLSGPPHLLGHPGIPLPSNTDPAAQREMRVCDNQTAYVYVPHMDITQLQCKQANSMPCMGRALRYVATQLAHKLWRHTMAQPQQVCANSCLFTPAP